jgi:hypothetical protein
MRTFLQHAEVIQPRGQTGSRSRFSKVQKLACGVAAGLIVISPAQAQDVHSPLLDSPIPLVVNDGRLIEVMKRPRPEYAAPGIRLNGFILSPKVQVGAAATNNVYGAKINPTSDVVALINPSLALSSDWKSGSLNISGGGNLRRYMKQTIRNENGFFLTANGQYELRSNLALFGQVDHRQAYLPQYSSDSPTNSLSPIVEHNTTGLLRTEYTGGLVKIAAAVDFANLLHDDVVLASGVTQSQRYRNRLLSRFSTRVEYSFRNDVTGFVEGNVQKSDFYQDVLLDGSPNRNGKTYRAIGGLVTNISPLARAWVGIGYIKLDFDAGIYKPISGFAYDAKILIVPSGLTTVTLQAKRAIMDSATTGSGYYTDILQARVDHELMRNLLLYVQGGHDSNSFRGIERNDKIWRGELGSTLLVDRNTVVSGAINYVNRASDNAQLQSYSEWRGTLAVTLGL